MRRNFKYLILVGGLFLLFLMMMFILMPAGEHPSGTTLSPGQEQSVAQFNRQQYSGYLWRLVGVSVLLLVVLGISLWWVRRVRAQSQLKSQYRLKVLARLPLGPRQFLLVVGVAERKLLLGMTDQSVNLLRDLGPWDEAESESDESLGTDATTFLSVFNRLRGKDV